MIPEAPEPLITKIRKGNRFLLTSHVNPDGDAIGSELALGRILRKLGKGATIWNRDPTPKLYQALPGADRVHNGEEPPAGFPQLFNGIIVLECPALARTGLEETLTGLPLYNIDHHLGNEHYGNINWVDPAAPAVGEMVYRLARTLKIEVDKDLANALYLTLVTDTGGFRFSNTTPETFEAAAALLREGASPETVAGWLFDSQPEPAIRLLGAMLGTLELHGNGKVATVWLNREMFAQAQAEEGDAEGLIDYPRSIAGVEAVALFKQLEGGGHKVSLRSRGQADVEAIARSHGGGGHHNAAGFLSDAGRDPLQNDTVEALIAAVS